MVTASVVAPQEYLFEIRGDLHKLFEPGDPILTTLQTNLDCTFQKYEQTSAPVEEKTGDNN